jgi:hypothetical protein
VEATARERQAQAGKERGKNCKEEILHIMFTLTDKDEFDIMMIRADVHSDAEISELAHLSRATINSLHRGEQASAETVQAVLNVLLPRAAKAENGKLVSTE